MNPAQFRFREPAATLFLNRQKVSLFHAITRKVSPIFFCGGDVMTTGPMVTGFHEPEVLHLLAFLAKAGFDKALVDVGANIGLMTYHSRDLFGSFHCFEPNPRIFNVLRANLFGWDETRLHLHNIGIGDSDSTAVLTIPLRNQGGAFISGGANAYRDDILTDHKHAMGGVARVEVAVRRGRDVFTTIFAEAPDGRFVVKIDTEGFERTVIAELAAAMPGKARIAIVLENLDPRLSPANLLPQRPGQQVTALKLQDNVSDLKSRPLKDLIKLTRGKTYRLTDQPKDWLGNVLLIVETDYAENAQRQRKLARSRPLATMFRLSSTAPVPPNNPHFWSATARACSNCALSERATSTITVLLLAAMKIGSPPGRIDDTLLGCVSHPPSSGNAAIKANAAIDLGMARLPSITAATLKRATQSWDRHNKAARH
jgi:FkbM family methyltransferase